MATSNLPDVSSPTIILARPTHEEQIGIWTATQPSWGPSLTVEAYIKREEYQTTIPLARDGGLTPWILTDSTAPPGQRPVLSSCETLRKRALVRNPDGTVRHVWAHGVASVFTIPTCRGRGYASKMMALVGDELARRQRDQPGDAVFSILFSDIGPVFYSRQGWLAHPSTNLDFPVPEDLVQQAPAAVDAASANAFVSACEHLKPVYDADLAALAAADEALLRLKVAGPPSGSNPSGVKVAVVPDLATLQWHYCREDFVANSVVGLHPTIRGAVYTVPGTARRVWALWTRTIPGGYDKRHFNVLNLLRLVVEDEAATTDDELADALRAILAVASRQAAQWLCPKTDLWNPNDRVRRVVESLDGVRSEFVVRDKFYITSLRWFGEERAEDVEWVANEKFEWC